MIVVTAGRRRRLSSCRRRLRPDKPATDPNPAALQVRPDKAGRIQFNLGGHPWPEVLQWYADVAHLSLDWQELPSDYINLTTQRSYSLEEARDLLNRHHSGTGCRSPTARGN